MFTPDRNRPVPAAIDGRRWSVADSPGGATDTKKASMFAPLADSPSARLIRNHELIHALITPRIDAGTAAKKYGATVQALQWAEDYRVSLLQYRRNLVDADAVGDEESALLAKAVAHDRRQVAGILLACMPMADQRRRYADALVNTGRWSRDELEAVYATLRDICDAAYRPFRGRRAGSRVKPTGFAKITAPLARMFDLEFPENPPPGDGDGARVDKKLEAIRGAGQWGRLLDVARLPLTRAVKPRRPIGRRFSDTGVIPSAVHRLPVDGSIFTTKRRAKGGTILCDNSGSMHYHDSDIERILSDAPAATVAFYAGGRRGGKPVGRIVVAAERGRAAAVQEVEKAMPGGENFIDGPALRWLARQPAPRYWVSDEAVGGVSDFGKGGPCHSECVAICRAANITIVPRIEALK
jgi:hypothetical protein